MKNKMMSLLPLLLFSSAGGNPTENVIILDSAILKMADGNVFNGDKVEFMRGTRRIILAFLLGDLLPNGQRKGKYKLAGTYHSIQSLARIEQEIKNSTDKKDIATQLALDELLTQAKADFIVQSNEFIKSGRGSKNILIVLIQEDCQKRNRLDSLLLDWAKTQDGQESTMFETHVTSFAIYYHFCTDLANFLLDLIHSCPKAEAQFKDRVAKWSAVKNILPTVLKKAHVKTENINEIEFLKYLKERYLDHIALNEITPPVILPLLTEYIKHTRNYD